MGGFPFIRQHDSMMCGIACLQMVCCHYGKKIAQDYLSEFCSATAEGVSLLGISTAAKKLGMRTVCGKLSVKQLDNEDLPCILHWKQNHFVVLYKVKKGERFCIADPGKGLVTYSREEFIRYWVSDKTGNEERGIAMFLEPTPEFHAMEYSSEESKRSFRFLMGYFKKYQASFSLIVLGLVIGCILQLLMPFLTQAIVDNGIKNNDIGLVWLILLGELMIVLGRAAAGFMRSRILLSVSMKINISLVSDFFAKLLKLPMAFFDTKLMGDLMQRMGDHNRVQSFLTGQALNVLFSILSFIVFGAVLLVYDRLIFAIFIAGSVLYGLWITVFLGRRKVLDYEQFEKHAINQNKTYQFISNMQEIKLQDCERRRRAEWEQVQNDLFAVQMKSLKLQQTQEAGSVLLNEIKNIVITATAATAVINGDITLGTMLAIQYIIGQLNAPVEQFMAFIYSLQDVKISLERINEIHEGRNEESPQENLTAFPEAPCHIVIDGMSFKYDRHALKYTIEDIDIHIPEGKVTAIVGASGSGKTTLIKLRLGLYPVNEGYITIAGENINRYSLKWWRRQCGVVMQEGVIFSESIARNIAVDDGEIDERRMIQAAEMACIKDYILSLPLKFNTIIGRDGVGLSQGQKQRILIARAVYKNPSFIFLDEATNALDAKNERAIVENLNEFYKGRTVVIVAHRLSTVKNADNIIVLEGGRVAETGNHESLIAQRGAYFNLVRNQLELGN